MQFDSPDYHLRQIKDCAEAPPGGPLGQRPFLAEALAFFRCHLEPQTPGDVLKAVCAEVYERQAAVMGELD